MPKLIDSYREVTTPRPRLSLSQPYDQTDRNWELWEADNGEVYLTLNGSYSHPTNRDYIDRRFRGKR